MHSTQLTGICPLKLQYLHINLTECQEVIVE